MPMSLLQFRVDSHNSLSQKNSPLGIELGIELGTVDGTSDGLDVSEGRAEGLRLGALETPIPPPHAQHASFKFLSK